MITITPKVNGMYRSSYSVYLLQYHIVTKYRNPVLQGSVKTRSARFARRDYPDTVDKYYWKSYFWNNAYFVSTVSENTLANFETYIRKQGMKSKNRLIK